MDSWHDQISPRTASPNIHTGPLWIWEDKQHFWASCWLWACSKLCRANDRWHAASETQRMQRIQEATIATTVLGHDRPISPVYSIVSFYSSSVVIKLFSHRQNSFELQPQRTRTSNELDCAVVTGNTLDVTYHPHNHFTEAFTALFLTSELHYMKFQRKKACNGRVAKPR